MEPSSQNNDKEVDPFRDLIMNESLAKNEWPGDKMNEYQKEEKQSLMVKNMTEDLFNKLKDHKTKSAGWSIARAINTGVQYPGSFVGIHAGDLESYIDFKDIFQPVVEQVCRVSFISSINIIIQYNYTITSFYPAIFDIIIIS